MGPGEREHVLATPGHGPRGDVGAAGGEATGAAGVDGEYADARLRQTRLTAFMTMTPTAFMSEAF